jgi:hypothetical protein
MFSGGRLKVVALVCLIAVLAIPTLAFASGAPTTSSKAAVKLVWTPAAAIKTLGAKILVGGNLYTATVAGHATATAFAVLTDGAKTVVATGKDNVTGLPVTESWVVTVNEAPKFGVSVPANGKSLTTTPTAITVAVKDNTAVTAATAVVNGSAPITGVIAGGVATFATPTQIVQGGNTVLFDIADAAGNHTTKSISFMNVQALSAAACMKCHSGAQIGFGSTMNASGHNTTENGVIGGKTKFDGSQGVQLTWTANAAFTVTNIISQSSTNGTAAVSVAPGTSFTLGQTGIVNSNWALPTKSVFWPAVNDGVQDAPSTAIKGLSWTSVITCENCHTAFNATGPHGSSANAGLDTNYPADYSMAMLSKKVTSDTTFDFGVNRRYTASGIAVGTGALGGTLGARTAGTAWTTANLQDGTTGANAVICAKCHRLEQVVAAGWASNGVTMPYPVVVGANTAHNSHHQDTSDGTAQCVSCHVGITHGWKAPRLLVDIPTVEANPALAQFVSENKVEDMGSISALNNHPLIGADGYLPYGNGTMVTTPNTSLAGTVLWDEQQCEACGDHAGNTIVLNSGGQQSNTAVPVRINF